MKKFEINRFRKFENKVMLRLEGYNSLVGANNEGKTSVCDALEIFFNFLGGTTSSFRATIRRNANTNRSRYNYARDYPLTRASQKRRHPTEFLGTFAVEEADLEELKPFNIFGPEVTIKLFWNFKSQRLDCLCPELGDPSALGPLLRLISKKVRFISIPAIREQDTLLRNISSLFDESVRIQIEKSRKISKIRKQLSEVIDPAVSEVKKQLNASVKEFLPTLKDLDIEWSFEIERVVNLETIYVDDGHKTPIYLKGDGIKNLLWLGNLTYLAQLQAEDKTASRIFVIEEPEAHLNSSILYKLKQQLLMLAEHSTVISTTHSPVFLDFSKNATAYLVSNGTITPSHDKAKIAEALGVRIQENLRSNTVGILVEGSEDEIAINAIAKSMPHFNIRLDKCDIIKANGTGNIAHAYQLHKGLFQDLFILLDKDAAGDAAMLSLKNINTDLKIIFTCPTEPGYLRAELEDLIEIDFLVTTLSKIYGRSFDLQEAIRMKKQYKGKFKEWIIHYVNKSGLAVSDADSIKYQLWDFLKTDGNIKLTDTGTTYFKALFDTVNNKLSMK